MTSCAWCPSTSRGNAWHNDGQLHPSCGQPDHGQGWVPEPRPFPDRDTIAQAIDSIIGDLDLNDVTRAEMDVATEQAADAVLELLGGKE